MSCGTSQCVTGTYRFECVRKEGHYSFVAPYNNFTTTTLVSLLTLKGHKSMSRCTKSNGKHLSLVFLCVCVCVCQVFDYTGSGHLGTGRTRDCQEQEQVCPLQRLCPHMAAEGTCTVKIVLFIVS